LKVPHIGWSPLQYKIPGGLAQNGTQGEQVFFVHSLYTDCSDASDIAATATYGLEFPAAIQRGNVWGTQFHPEKSSAVGLRILRNFLEA
jgi:glutamine amidotransferase